MKHKNLSKIIFLSLFFTIIFNVNPNLSADDFRGWSSFGRLAYEVENKSDKDIATSLEYLIALLKAD